MNLCFKRIFWFSFWVVNYEKDYPAVKVMGMDYSILQMSRLSPTMSS